MDPWIGLIGVGLLFVLIALHVPIGVSMALVGVGGFAYVVGLQPALSLLATETTEVITNTDLAVIPLFLIMGNLARVGGLASDIYSLASAFVGHRRGGLAMATVVGCAGFGSVCGSGVATAATFGRVALPEMEKRNYAMSLSAGSIAAGGTLGIIIPPSTVMVVYAVLSEQFILDLFSAAIGPAILSIFVYCLAIFIVTSFKPESGPPGPRHSWKERLVALRRGWGVGSLAIAVLGGIYSGIFTVQEAASVGVTISLIFALMRKALNRNTIIEVLEQSSATSVMIYVIIIGASILSYFISVTHLADFAVEGIESLDLSGLGVIVMLLILYLFLGAFFDELAAVVLTLPVVLPVVTGLGYDPVWWGILMVCVIGIGMISPPIGMNVFVLRAVAPRIGLGAIYKGVTPFVLADLVKLGLLASFPQITLWGVRLLN
jgi:tripartite ATP-independent transporter DctM subunit